MLRKYTNTFDLSKTKAIIIHVYRTKLCVKKNSVICPLLILLNHFVILLYFCEPQVYYKFQTVK